MKEASSDSRWEQMPRLTAICYVERKSKLEVSSNPSLEFKELHGGEGGKVLRVIGNEDTRRTRPSESTKQGVCKLAESEASSTGLHRSAPAPLHSITLSKY